MQHRALLALTEGRAAAGVSEAAAPTAVVVEVQPVQADNAAIANDDAVDLQRLLLEEREFFGAYCAPQLILLALSADKH